jgi:uncharacterized protein YceH (UPF0502 family)
MLAHHQRSMVDPVRRPTRPRTFYCQIPAWKLDLAAMQNQDEKFARAFGDLSQKLEALDRKVTDLSQKLDQVLKELRKPK